VQKIPKTHDREQPGLGMLFSGAVYGPLELAPAAPSFKFCSPWGA
jgi:hypothetical protein